MAKLRPWLLAAAIAFASPAHAGSLDRWSAHIAEASARFGIPDAWIRRVMEAESGGRARLNGRPIVSRAGAMGLMQLMPGTWRAMRAAHGLGPDPHAPRDNILAGTAYLRAMYDRFGYPGLFAAYNAGPRAYAAYLAGTRRLPSETVAYLTQTAGHAPSPRSPVGGIRLATAPAERPSLFAIRGEPGPPRAGGQVQQSAGTSLFFTLRGGTPP